MKITYSHKTSGKVIRYYFEFESDENIIHFYTFKDLSGFCIDYGVNNAETLILLGASILINMDYIKESINLNK